MSPVPLPTSGRARYTGGLTKQKINQTTNADFSKGKMRLREARGMPKAGGGPTKEEGRKLRAGLVAVSAETFWCRPDPKWHSFRFFLLCQVHTERQNRGGGGAHLMPAEATLPYLGRGNNCAGEGAQRGNRGE